VVESAESIRNGRADARRGRTLLPVLPALLLVACATYQPAPIDPVASAERFTARRLDTAEMRAKVAELLPQSATQPWPPAAWDRAALLAAALSLNPKLAVARAQVEAAVAHEITAGQTPNPQLTLQSEYAHREPHPWLYGLSLDLLLRSSTRRDLETGLARLETSTARWQLMDSAWAVRRALVSALSDWLAATQRMAHLERLAAAQDRLIAQERQRVAAGEDTSDELLIVSQARIGIEQQQAQARSEAAAAFAALAATVGVTPTALDGLAFDWADWGSPPPAPTSDMQGLGEQALRARSDLAAAIDDYAAAENRLHQAVVHQYPQFQLSPGYYWDHGIAKFPFDVGFTMPLFNRSEGEIAEARASREVAGQRMLAVQAEIIGAIAAAERAELVAQSSVAAAERGFDAARRQREHAALSLRLGGIAASEDTAAELLVLRSQLEVAQTRAQLQAARNALEDALHAPLSGPELNLASPLPAAITGAAR
jgi:cobalt-zinc-cadmium efflux system outer membrane protein